MRKHAKKSTVILALALAMALLCPCFAYGDGPSSVYIGGDFVPPETGGGSDTVTDLSVPFGSDGIHIDTLNFPDDNFRAFVSKEYDTDSDGKLSESEIDAADLMYVIAENIKSLKGIEFLSKLKVLNCNGNEISSLDLSGNTELEELRCSGVSLESIDLTGCSKLSYAELSINNLEELDISTNPMLRVLLCDNGDISELDISNNPFLCYAYENGKTDTENPDQAYMRYYTEYDDGSGNTVSCALGIDKDTELICAPGIVPPEIKKQPQDATAHPGQEVVFEIDTSDNTVGFQWEQYDYFALKWKNETSGSNTSRLTVTAPSNADDNTVQKYRCRVWNEVYVVYSNEAVMMINSNEEPSAPLSEIDKSELDKSLDEAEALKEEEFTAESFAAVKEAYDVVKNLAEDADQETVDAAAKALNDAIEALEKKPGETPPEVDWTELNALIETAEALKEEDYTPESYAKIKGAVEAAKALPDDADQNAVNEASAAIIESLNVLPSLWGDVGTKRLLLKTYIVAVEKTYAEEDYTAESYAKLKEALEAAKALPDDADEEAVEAAYKALNDALGGLVKKVPVDTAELEKAIEKAEKIDEDKYTEASLTILDAILGSAKAALKSDDPEEVEKAVKALNTALDALEEKSLIPFTDVAKEDYFYDAVVWAFTADPQVTDGTSATTFSPKNSCTRAQVVTFLWRTQGCPEPETKVNPFADVAESDWFYKPVLWAVEKGITDGTSPTTFSPKSTCKNSHILTFIYRAVGEPNKTGTGTWWTDAFNWANFGGLLAGSYTGEYDINAECPRANVVYYLHQMNK